MPAEVKLQNAKAVAAAATLLALGSVVLIVVRPPDSAQGPVRAVEIARVLLVVAAPIAGVLVMFARSIVAPASPVGLARGRHLIGPWGYLMLILFACLAAVLWVSGGPALGVSCSVAGSLVLLTYLSQQRQRRQLSPPPVRPELSLTPGFLPGGAVSVAILTIGGLSSGALESAIGLMFGTTAIVLYVAYGRALVALARRRRAASGLAWGYLGVLIVLLYMSQLAPDRVRSLTSGAALIGGILLAAIFVLVEGARRGEMRTDEAPG